MKKTPNPKELRKHFVETLYRTLDGVISPTPYLEITEGANVDVRFLNGKGRLPAPNSTEVTVLDMNLASLFFDDFHILYEGVTGTGKTYTSDALFDTVFGPDGHYTLRLSGGVLGSSALEPFVTTTLENGIPKTRIDHAKCSKYGALFIDEINRGDSQEVLQVVDGKVHVNGDTGFLRIPIPGTDRYKSLAIIAAMNPADAQHSSALELDIAGENRFLKFRFPNGVAEAGSGQLEKRVTDSHDQFWTEFIKRTGMKGGWRENYPLVTDPEQVSNVLDGQTKEFIDISLGYVGADPKETYERNAELMKQGGVDPKFRHSNDNHYKKILEIQGTLKHGFVRRDLKKISDLSRLLGFIKGVKNGTYDAQVNLNDVAASIGIVLESKSVTGTPHGNLMTLVNDARGAYAQMRQQHNIPEGYGMRQAIWQAALHAGNEHGFDAYINTINNAVAQLNTQATTHAQTALKSRILSDLVVLGYFSQAYKDEITSALTEKDNIFRAFAEIYKRNKSRGSVYEHRLDSMVG
ncbi:MAG: hypothetical protein G01um101477_589 [Candidatus Doudnabacteria bacterium Gr01-1014_77]|uniref:ATPase dynein-related AAA domain-containing protein n=1 Tax=Candidatus Doudnabacteria bacterium Gr01-1014_77 TaxID=2017133 RepID=A0A554J9Z3_9BACT|nr:MAG: hypothetical protein G01um101477_589 [Candidatus Doudnabacteria bacterium Gr01-1014_77]